MKTSSCWVHRIIGLYFLFGTVLGCNSDPSAELEQDSMESPTFSLPERSVEFTSPGDDEDGDEERSNVKSPLDLGPPQWEAPSSLGPGFTEITGDILWGNGLQFDDWNGLLGDEADKTHGVFADLNGDGIQEVVLGGQKGCQLGSCPVVYRFDEAAGYLVRVPDADTNLPPIDLGSIAGWIDVDGNGKKDILFNFGANHIMMQNEDGTWRDPIAGNVPPTYPYPEYRNKGGITVVDLDEDGLLDLLVGDSTCEEGSISVLPLFQVRPGIFETRFTTFSSEFPGSPDALLATPLGPPGAFVVQMIGRSCSSAEAHSGFYERTDWDEDGFPVFEEFEPFGVEAHFKKFPAVSYGYYTLAHPMGATVGDLDLDGLWDTISTYSTPNYPSVMPLFGVFRGAGTWPFDDWSTLAEAGPPYNEGMMNQLPWGNALIDVTGDGMSDLITVNGPDWSGLNQESNWAGLQDVTLHVAVDYMRFQEATSLLQIDNPGHWRSLTIGDLEGDGDADMIVGGFGVLPRVYRNDVDTGNRFLAIQLKGTTSNFPGIGAVVTVETEGAVVAQPQLMGHIGSPLALSEPLVFAGLGSSESAEKVTVTWPSGVVQIVENLPHGQIHLIEEPELLSILPANRQTTPDKKFLVTVTPRDTNGALNPDVEVKAKVVFGEGRVISIVPIDEGYEVAVVSSDAPGMGVLEITLDGEPVGIRPRLYWEESTETP